LRGVGDLSASKSEEAAGLSVSAHKEFESDAHRKRKVPTNSPAMAMKWFRGLLGILMKNEDAFGPCIFSSAPEGVAPVFGPLCRPKRPGKKPDLGLIFSIAAVRSCLLSHAHLLNTNGRRKVRPHLAGMSRSRTRLNLLPYYCNNKQIRQNSVAERFWNSSQGDKKHKAGGLDGQEQHKSTFSSEMELIRVILIDAMSGKIMVAHRPHTKPQASKCP
jgi:hypothetical protein